MIADLAAPAGRSTVARRVSQVSTAGLVITTILVLHVVGRGDLAAPPTGSVDVLRAWSEHRDPITIGFAVVRLAALAVAYHLVATSLVMAAGRILRSPRLVHLAHAATLPPLRGTVRRLVGLGLSAGVALTQPLPTAQAHPQAAVTVVASGVLDDPGGRVVLERIPPDVPGRAELTLVVTGSGLPTGSGRAVLEQIDRSDAPHQPAVLERIELPGEPTGRAVLEQVRPDHPTGAAGVDPGSADGSDQPTAGAADGGGPDHEVHVVAPGDHLWSIATGRLTGVLGRPPTDAEVAPYWEVLVAANPQLVDPDLLFPGDEVAVPQIQTG